MTRFANLTFRPIKARPPSWRETSARRPSSPFRASYDRTLAQLRDELGRLDATEAFIQVEVESADLRNDGMLRAHAKITHPGVIVTAVTKKLGTLTWPAEAFNSWQGNLRAVALGLGHLRTLDRYGIAEMGQQYAGFNELGSGTPMGAGTMTEEEAADLLAAESMESPISGRRVVSFDEILDPATRERSVAMAYRIAAKNCHPDVDGGDPDLFRRITEARDLLLAG